MEYMVRAHERTVGEKVYRAEYWAVDNSWSAPSTWWEEYIDGEKMKDDTSFIYRVAVLRMSPEEALNHPHPSVLPTPFEN